MSKSYEKGKKKSAEKGKEAKEKAKRAGDEFRENSDNPVVIANLAGESYPTNPMVKLSNCLAVIGLGSGLLAYGAYSKYSVGQLTWKVVGAWAGVIGLIGVGDFYFSQYMFKNKYPRK